MKKSEILIFYKKEKNKKSQTKILYGFIGLLILIGIFSAFVLADDPPEEELTIWKRTATTNIYKNPDGTYTRTIGQGIINLDDETRRFPNYVPRSEFFRNTTNGYQDNTGFIYKLSDNKKFINVHDRYDNYMSSFGFAITGTIGGQNYKVSSLSYDWTWSKDIDETSAYFEGDNNAPFHWIQRYYLYKDKPMKIENYVENNVADITNAKFWYIQTVNQNDSVIWNGNNYSLGTTRHLEGNYDNVFPNVIFSDDYVFSYGDLIQNGFNITDIYIGDGEPIGADGEWILAVGVTKNNGNFPKGADVTLDPTIQLGDDSGENLEDVSAYWGLSTWTIAFVKFNTSSILDLSINITSSSLNIYTTEGGTLFSDKVVYCGFSNQTWTEDDTNATWFDSHYTNKLNCSANTTISSDGWHSLNALNIVKKNIEVDENDYTSILIYEPVADLTLDGVGSSDATTLVVGDNSPPPNGNIQFPSKEGASNNVYLNITYTPYIDIISPTPSQIFTESTPTTRFNVSTAVNMSTCYYELDSTNFTMNKENATLFNITNTSMIDGSHSVKFWCNQSSDGTWRVSETVSFDVDSVNVTVCRDLTVASRNYTLLNNISTTSSCFEIKNNNISFDMQNYNISGNNVGRGVKINIGYSEISVKNGSISNFLYGIFVVGGSSTIQNNTVSSCDIGIYINHHYNSIINNIAISNDESLHIETGDNNIITNFSSFLSTEHAIQFWYADNNIVYNFNSNNQVSVNASSTNNTLINVTYTTENVDSNSELIRKWYFQLQVNDSRGYLQNAGVNITNVTGNNVHSELTDANGSIGREELIEYVNIGGTKTYHTPHTINISKTNYITNSTTYNITIEHNLEHIVTLVNTLLATITHPKAQFYSDNESMELNYSILNYTNMDTCLYYVLNSTSGYEISNTTIADCINTTFNISEDGTYTLYLFANTTEGVNSTDDVTFGVSTDAPAVVLNAPSDNTYFNYTENIYFNFTATDLDGLSHCQLWHNATDTWHLNYSWISPTNATMNYTILNISEGSYIWNVWCNDTFDNSAYALNNFTLTIDTTKPTLSIDSITTTLGYQTFSFTNTITDINLGTCKYSIFNSTGGIDGLNENVSFTCGSTTSPTVTAFATYNLTIYAIDLASNENSTTDSFTTSPTPLGVPGGGGGPTITIIQAKDFSITTTNFQKNMDISLAKDSTKPRKKAFYITNKGVEEITVSLECDTVDVNESSRGINICDYVTILDDQITILPTEEIREIGYFEVMTPEDAELGDKYYFNILAKEGETTINVDKLSVSTRVSVLSMVYKWKGKEGRTPIAAISIVISIILFTGSLIFFSKIKKLGVGSIISVIILFSSFFFFLFIL